jgi:uncharacterized membrane protein (UPF0127 family)
MSIKVLILCFLAVVSGCAESATRWVCINGTCIQADVAQTPSKRAQGLMFRKGIGEREGMLFIFDEEGQHPFWMKNMNFPLDILWVNGKKEIVDTAENVPPCGQICEDLVPEHKAKFVLEVPGGFARKYHIKVGERLSF